MNILYFGRKSDKYSLNLYNFLCKKNNKVKVIWSDGKKSKIDFSVNKKYDLIICFRSSYILKKKHINLARIAAINFHPGTPKYRGIGCVNLALLNKDNQYGSTAHLINQKIDKGKIIDVKYFKILQNDNVNKVLNKTHKIMYRQFKDLINLIIKDPKIIKSLIYLNRKKKWSNKLMTRKQLNKLYEINYNIKNLDLKNTIRALNYKNFKLKFMFNGIRFKQIQQN